MTRATAFGSALVGLEAQEVRITADVEPCDPSEACLVINGLPETTTRETRLRVRSALGYDVHRAHVTVEAFPELADAAPLDLPIAVAVLRAMGATAPHPDISADTVFVGELALDGRVRPVRGALCRVGSSPIVVPEGNAWETGLAPGAEAYSVSRIVDLCNPLPRIEPSRLAPHAPHGRGDLPEPVRRALDACKDAGRALLVGPPGCGKTVVARALASSSEPLSPQEGRDVVRIYGAAGICYSEFSSQRPFRAPHHTVSEAGLFGGGKHPRPGEVTLAHRGVLFLDEIPEFRRTTVQALACALRDREARFVRHGETVRFPAEPEFVIASAGPCPCGYAGHPGRACKCTAGSRDRHEKRLAELCELLGLHRIEVPQVELSEILPQVPS